MESASGKSAVALLIIMEKFRLRKSWRKVAISWAFSWMSMPMAAPAA